MLEISNLRAGYGAINILWDMSLAIEEHKLTAIVGPNGAGKTTLLRAMMGLAGISAGSIRFGERRCDRLPPWERVASGIAFVPEGRAIFSEMSVEDNLLMGAFLPACRAEAARNLEKAYDMFPRLKERRAQQASSLSGGEAKMLAIARALMSEPKVLLIDEPSLGLAPIVFKELFGIIRKLRTEGRTIVLVEQNTRIALSVADHVYLVQNGKVVLSKSGADADLNEIHELYFGG